MSESGAVVFIRFCLDPFDGDRLLAASVSIPRKTASDMAEALGGEGRTTPEDDEATASEDSVGCNVASCFFRMFVREKALEQKRHT